MKNIINWNYERASWQWDLLCLLIMAFIFLTPKAWFNKIAALTATQTQGVAVERVDSGHGLLDQGR
ncbi:MAG: hypothetical protein KBD94_12305 [Pyrinomonadaceae bacterium]|nr:hypothetical protein [Pyrinomonadaceae bacterium]